MTRPKNSNDELSGDINETQVKQFLEANPWFIERNNDTLLNLLISHQAGSATSLLEKQNNVLRAKISEQGEEKKKLLGLAEKNWEFTVRLSHLAQDLIGRASLEEVFDAVSLRMERDFGADEIMMEIRDKRKEVTNFGVGLGLMELVQPKSDDTDPISGPVKKEHRELFQLSSKSIKSVVIIPMVSVDWKGVLVVGSTQLGRYEGGGRIEFLSHLRDIVVLALDPILRN